MVNLALENKFQWNFNRNLNIFIQENAIGNVVCEMASILSRPQCVNNTAIGTRTSKCRRELFLQATDSIFRPGADGFPDGSDEYHLFRDAINHLQNQGNTCTSFALCLRDLTGALKISGKLGMGMHWDNILTYMYFVHRRQSSLQWRHDRRDSVSNHQPRDCLFNHLFRRRSKKYQSSAPLVFVQGIPAQMASYAENVSIWWRHHVMKLMCGQIHSSGLLNVFGYVMVGANLLWFWSGTVTVYFGTMSENHKYNRIFSNTGVIMYTFSAKYS